MKTDLQGDLAIAKCDLAELIQTGIETVQALAATKKVTLKPKVAEVQISADKAKVGLTLNRLFLETVQKAPAGSEVKIDLLSEGEDAVIRVWRLGETVSPAAFDPLEVSGEVLNHQQSMGLGLALGKMIVEAHGGTVHLSSDKVAGTLITYRLPRS